MILLTTILVFLIITGLVYHHIGWSNLRTCYAAWLRRDYWVSYNLVEAIAWLAKAAVIIPSLVFGKEIWQLHFVTLTTSALLIWVSERKLLPTLVAFNTLWIGISCIVIVRNLW